MVGGMTSAVRRVTESPETAGCCPTNEVWADPVSTGHERAGATINELTPARYLGLPVRVIGFAGSELLVIAARAMPEAIAIGVLHPTADGFRVGGSAVVSTTLADAATAAARQRERRDGLDLER